jgi:Xaa-Pro aminopeptidase
MKQTRREFAKNLGVGVAGIGLAAHQVGCSSPAAAKGDSEHLLTQDPDRPEPATYDRLPLSWYKKTAQRLKDRVAEKGVDAVLLQSRWNLIYFTGLFHTSTERPFSALFPVAEDSLFWFHPKLDDDLVTTWWSTDNEYYFDYLHAEGGFPDQGKAVQGQMVDLFEWTLECVKKRGFGDKVIGIDSELTPSKLKKFEKVLPKARYVNIGPDCLQMRIIKTPEEIALSQRAMDYSSKIHAFARDYILEKGTDATDFEVRHAAIEYGTNLMLEDIERDGKPHTAVGVSIRVSCRAGVATAYPHSNQFAHKKIEKGDAIQIGGNERVGGYGGQLARFYQVAPWDPHREKVWEVVRDCVQIQEEEAKAGKTCSEVAYKIHQYQVKHGMEKYIYHRPAHGQGMEGHQAPWLALGDYTVLEEGMFFSVEPGLYDPERGFGFNPSDNMLVTRDKGVSMGSLPHSKEWVFLKL